MLRESLKEPPTVSPTTPMTARPIPEAVIEAERDDQSRMDNASMLAPQVVTPAQKPSLLI